ncbi:hypothetical protein DPMN_031979 [Dreissena polymorpha]|uniref:Uncharacterized protein n=1 Tax=Dreissena polymorpha TaxID=45954 RepID=A0A9D4M2W2_DREPO|nr:hypothetical protein DPMN_031979 [Dreissena polymorpha]
MACAAAPRASQESEQEESMWVHEVIKATNPDVVSGSAVDKLTQVVEQLRDAVDRLLNSSGSSGFEPCVLQSGQRFRIDGGNTEYPVEGPYPGNVRSRWYNDRHQDRYPVGAGGGCRRGHRKRNACRRGPGPGACGVGAGHGRNSGCHVGYLGSDFHSE